MLIKIIKILIIIILVEIMFVSIPGVLDTYDELYWRYGPIQDYDQELYRND